jgi:hypothetical protein
MWRMARFKPWPSAQKSTALARHILCWGIGKLVILGAKMASARRCMKK